MANRKIRSFLFSLSRMVATAICTLPRKRNAALWCFCLALLVCSCQKGNEAQDVQADLNRRSEEAGKRHAGIHRMIYENPAEARAAALKLLSAPADVDTVSQIVLLKHIGSSYVFETNYPEALVYYNRALGLADRMKLYAETAHIKNNIGVIHNELGNFKLAYSNLDEAISNYELAGNTVRKVAAYNNIGITFLNIKNFDKALQYFNRALHPSAKDTMAPALSGISFSGTDTILVVSVLNNIALAYNSLDKPQLALAYLDRAVELSEAVNNRYGLCISHQIKGSVYHKMGQTGRAMESYRKSVVIAGDNHLSNQLAQSKIGLTEVLLDRGEIKEAFALAGEVMLLAEEQKSLVLQSEGHNLLSRLYDRSGDHKAALDHLRKHNKAREELVNQTIIHQIYDVELSSLSRKNDLQQLALEKTGLIVSKKNNLLLFVSVVSVLLLFGMYLIYLNHRHRQKVRLQETIIELTGKKSKAALEAEMEERKRIGSELHDSLGHLLSVAGLHASVLQKRAELPVEKRQELLQSLMKSIDDAFDEVRTISHNLAPSLLSERGLQGALKSISDKLNQTTGLAFTFDTYGLEQKMDKLIEHTLFRTIQEIVSNTIKHSKATRLCIQVTRGDADISLIAEDDGLGFNHEELNKSVTNGLAGMQSRIENLHGTMFIDSKPGRGTIINILIPINPENEPTTKRRSRENQSAGS